MALAGLDSSLEAACLLGFGHSVHLGQGLGEPRSQAAASQRPGGSRKKIFCQVTEQGEALHAQVMPLARASQAAAIRALPEEERNAMYNALMRLRAHCEKAGALSGEDEAGLE